MMMTDWFVTLLYWPWVFLSEQLGGDLYWRAVWAVCPAISECVPEESAWTAVTVVNSLFFLFPMYGVGYLCQSSWKLFWKGGGWTSDFFTHHGSSISR